MRLIDSNKIRDYVKEQINPYGKPFDGSAYAFGLKLIKYLENMSTAYDIDKVVEELEEMKTIKGSMKTVTCRKWDYGTVNRAIEIVKQGGVSDDVCELKYDDSFEFAKSNCGSMDTHRIDFRKLKYCPYCGKKIKVVE